ncbi:MAG: DUF2062 domain-containing protein [Thermoanaerobaculia bacterium]
MKLPTIRAFRRRRHPLSWRRRWRVLVADWLGREEPPERVAAAIALGVGVGFSPFVGFHILLALGLAFLFRLNRLDALLGQFIGNPWTIPPVFAIGYRLGRAILGDRARSAPPLNWSALLESDLRWVLHPIETVRAFFGGAGFLPRLEAFLIGTTALALAIALASYFVALALLTLFHRRHPRVAERAARHRAALIRRRQMRATRSGIRW